MPELETEVAAETNEEEEVVEETVVADEDAYFLGEKDDEVVVDDDDASEDELDEDEGDVDDESASEDDSSGVDDESAESEEVDQVALSRERDELLMRGARMNLDGEALLAFKDNDSLKASLAMAESMMPKDEDGKIKTGDDEKPPEWFKLPEGLEESMEAEEIELLKGMNEGTREAVTKLLDHKFGGMQQQNTAQFDALQSEMMLEQSNILDETLSEMGKEWAPLFGTGTGAELDVNSKEYKNRSQIFDEARSGRFSGSFAKRVVAAAKAMNPKIVEKAAKESVRGKARDRTGKLVNRNSNRKQVPSEQSRKQRTESAVAKILQKAGVASGELSDDSDFNGF